MAQVRLHEESVTASTTIGNNSSQWRTKVEEANGTQVYALRFYDVYQDIALELPEQPNINIVKAGINKVIRRINHQIGLWRQLVQVTPSAIIASIDAMTTISIDQETTDEIEDYGRFPFEWDWNVSLKRLRLDDNIVEVKEVYLDNEEWTQVDY